MSKNIDQAETENFFESFRKITLQPIESPILKQFNPVVEKNVTFDPEYINKWVEPNIEEYEEREKTVADLKQKLAQNKKKIEVGEKLITDVPNFKDYNHNHTIDKIREEVSALKNTYSQDTKATWLKNPRIHTTAITGRVSTKNNKEIKEKEEKEEKEEYNF